MFSWVAGVRVCGALVARAHAVMKGVAPYVLDYGGIAYKSYWHLLGLTDKDREGLLGATLCKRIVDNILAHQLYGKYPEVFNVKGEPYQRAPGHPSRGTEASYLLWPGVASFVGHVLELTTEPEENERQRGSRDNQHERPK